MTSPNPFSSAISSFYRKHKNADIVFGGGAGTMLQPYTLLVVRSGR